VPCLKNIKKGGQVITVSDPAKGRVKARGVLGALSEKVLGLKVLDTFMIMTIMIKIIYLHT
jgi:hypothetical protein